MLDTVVVGACALALLYVAGVGVWAVVDHRGSHHRSGSPVPRPPATTPATAPASTSTTTTTVPFASPTLSPQPEVFWGR